MKILILGPFKRNERIIEKLLEKHEIEINDQEINLRYLIDNKIEFIISNGYAPIIKSDVLKDYAKKIINIHPAYLPDGRGIYPNFWSFFEKYPKVATIHYIDENIDTGDILLSKKVAISSEDTLRSSLAKVMKAAEELFLENAEDIINSKIMPIKQSYLTYNSFYHSRIISEKIHRIATKQVGNKSY